MLYDFSLEKYLQAFIEKSYFLLRMTLGLWNNEVCRAAAVKDRAARLDPDIFDNNQEYESVCRAIGLTNTMVWQFYPGPRIYARAFRKLIVLPQALSSWQNSAKL